jgi:hypothetical protein
MILGFADRASVRATGGQVLSFSASDEPCRAIRYIPKSLHSLNHNTATTTTSRYHNDNSKIICFRPPKPCSIAQTFSNAQQAPTNFPSSVTTVIDTTTDKLIRRNMTSHSSRIFKSRDVLRPKDPNCRINKKNGKNPSNITIKTEDDW